jgi:DNA-binding SARP family transcriptional activator
MVPACFPGLAGIRLHWQLALVTGEDRMARRQDGDVAVMSASDTWVGILGPVEVRRGSATVPVSPGRPAVVLAVLAMSARRPVSVDSLARHVWGEDLPERVRGSLHSLIARLRRELGASLIVTKPDGYLLDIDPDQVDLWQFRELVAAAAAAGEPDDARALLGRALRLWRGELMAAPRFEILSRGVGTSLTEEWLRALHRRIDLDLAAGQFQHVIPELRELLGRHPLRESAWHQLVAALAGAGRHAEAIEAYHEARLLLAKQLGVDPSPDLQDIYKRVLTAAPAADSQEPGPSALAADHAAPPAQIQIGTWERRNYLPADVADFSGREEELRLLTSPSNGSGRAMVIRAVDGMPGVGKTTLAVHAGHLLADKYPDGLFFLDLHGHAEGHQPTAPGDALETLLHAAGVPGDQIPQPVDERVAMWRTLLAHRRVLLILDNAADAAQVRSLLPGTDTCLTLVTSRRRLADLDTTITLSLDVLPLSDALRLFAAIVGPARTAAEPGYTEEVVRMCGCLPLAVRIAAARLRARPAWTVGHIRARLADEQHRMAVLSAGHRSVAAAFSLSYQALPPAQQRMFRLLGLIPGGDFDVHLAAACADVQRADADQILEELVDVHLLQQSTADRYHLHDLLRQHALTAASVTEPSSSRRGAVMRVLDHRLHRAGQAARQFDPRAQGISVHLAETEAEAGVPRIDGPAQALAWFEQERANLVATVIYAAEHGWHTHAWQLPRALWWFLRLRGYHQDWITTHQHALTAARYLGERRAQAETLRALGIAYWQTAQYTEALDATEQAIALHEEIGDQAGEVAALTDLSLHYQRLGRYDHALNLIERAQKLDDGTNRRTHATVMAVLGRAHRELGQRERALEHVNDALVLYREVGDQRYEGIALNQLGLIHRDLGDHDAAMAWHHRALTLLRESGDRSSEAAVLNDIGDTLRAAGTHRESAMYHRQAIDIARAIYNCDQLERGRAGLALSVHAIGTARDRVSLPPPRATHGSAQLSLACSATSGVRKA